ncbi:hypothetical protein AVEN_152723-1 [Araneus ventricosus]|uniref:Uncharacterized protein n=1 Tax=Araneus ventricosus TaxID=182803 RepID=A0A4Y2H450_ARAVE|nr:hypothetical protein AVEN_152723-1 [Araneus ventricosus]
MGVAVKSVVVFSQKISRKGTYMVFVASRHKYALLSLAACHDMCQNQELWPLHGKLLMFCCLVFAFSVVLSAKVLCSWMIDNLSCLHTDAVPDCLGSEGVHRIICSALSHNMLALENICDAYERDFAIRPYPPTKFAIPHSFCENGEWDLKTSLITSFKACNDV